MIVNELAPGLKVRPATKMGPPPEVEIEVVLETLKVATSVGLFGIVAGVQLAAVVQNSSMGFKFQVALPAKAESKKEELRTKKIARVFFISLCLSSSELVL